MDLILLVSISIRVAALVWSLRLLARLRDWRFGLLSAMLALMATRQVLTLARGWRGSSGVTGDATELPGLAVSMLALGFVVLLSRLIQERDRVHAELMVGQARLSEAQGVAGVGSWEVAVSTEQLWCSPELLRIFGLDDDARLVPDTFFGVVHPDDREHLEAVYQGSRQTGTPFDETFRLRLGDGSVRHVRARAKISFDSDGIPEKMYGTVQDVTDLREAEDAIRASEMKLQDQLLQLDHIYRTAPVGLAVMDTGLRYVRINEFLAEINGKTIEEHLGRTLAEVIPEIAEVVEPLYRSVIESGEPALNLEVHGTTPADPETPRTWLVSYFPQRALDGPVIGVSSVVQEITDRARLESEVLRASERERRRLGGELHDGVGQVVTGTQYQAGALTRQLEREGHPAREAASELTEQLGDVLTQLRAVARGLSPVDLDAGGLVRALEGMTERFMEVYDLSCSFSCPNGLEVADPDVAIHVFRIAQEAMTNTARHARASRLDVSLETEGEEIVLRVRDDGIGLERAANVGGAELDGAASVEGIRGYPGGMGLRLMKYRAGVIRGRTLVTSSDEGTEVVCTFPLDPTKH